MSVVRWAILFVIRAVQSAAPVDRDFILGLLDPNVNACDDFYAKVCGEWRQDHAMFIDNDPYEYNTTQELFWDQVNEFLTEERGTNDTKLSKMKAAYQQCLQHGRQKDDSGVDQVHRLLRRLGIHKWPESTNSKKSPNWISLYVSVSTTLNLNVLLDISMKPDEKNPSSHAITMKMPNLGIPDEILLTEPSQRNDAAIKAYKNYIEKSIDLFKVKTNVSQPSPASVSEDIIKFEMQLANISSIFWFDPDELGDADYNYDEYLDESGTETPTTQHPDLDITRVQTGPSRTVSDLTSLAPGINWKSLLTKLFSKAKVEVKNSDKVVLDDRIYHERLSKLLNKTRQRTIANYFGWRIIQTVGPLINSKMADVRRAFYESMNQGLDYGSSRQIICLEELAGGHGTARELIGRIYAQKNFRKNRKERVEKLAQGVKEAYETVLQKASWLSRTTKKNELHKLSSMVFTIGYAAQLLDQSYVKGSYKWMEDIQPDMDLLDILKMFRENRRLNELKNLGKKYDRTKDIGFVSPTSVDPYYSPMDNRIVFPAAALQVPFFDKKFSSTVALGMLGWTITRLVSYGLIPRGGWFSSDGMLLEQNYWSSQSKQEESKKRMCFNSLYNKASSAGNYTRTTINADLVDNIGLNVAFKALKRCNECTSKPGRFTCEQLFFLSAGVGMCLNMRELQLRRPQDLAQFSNGKERIQKSTSKVLQLWPTCLMCGAQNNGGTVQKKQKTDPTVPPSLG